MWYSLTKSLKGLKEIIPVRVSQSALKSSVFSNTFGEHWVKLCGEEMATLPEGKSVCAGPQT